MSPSEFMNIPARELKTIFEDSGTILGYNIVKPICTRTIAIPPEQSFNPRRKVDKCLKIKTWTTITSREQCYSIFYLSERIEISSYNGVVRDVMKSRWDYEYNRWRQTSYDRFI